jgi:hypothetical protein
MHQTVVARKSILWRSAQICLQHVAPTAARSRKANDCAPGLVIIK